MREQSYRFRLGSFECVAIDDGPFTYRPPSFPPPAVFLFNNAPEDRLDCVLREHGVDRRQWTEWTTPYTCLLVDTGSSRVLIDTGAGSLAPSTGNLCGRLQAEGFDRNEIDTVILTHAHPDHIGGITNDSGELFFPNARFVMSKREWEFWRSEDSKALFDGHVGEVLFSVVDKNLPAIQDRIDLLEDEAQIAAGISAISAPGHTPGHIALSIISEGNELLFLSDTLLHPIHAASPDWHAAIDVDPARAASTKRLLLDRAASTGSMVLAFHFPFPGVGHVTKAGDDRWRWRPGGES